jgi:hypothetical protein
MDRTGGDAVMSWTSEVVPATVAEVAMVGAYRKYKNFTACLEAVCVI